MSRPSVDMYNPAHISDWLSRVTIPELYPRKDDPFAPGLLVVPGHPEMTSSPPPAVPDVVTATVTLPGQRPFVIQRAANFTLTANTPAVPIINNQFYCDTMILDVYSSAANSAFIGFGPIGTTTGIEIRPGLPIAISTDNTREQWELQRSLDLIAGLLARMAGLPDVTMYRAPRVVFDASNWFLAASPAVAVSVMLFFVPELQ